MACKHPDRPPYPRTSRSDTDVELPCIDGMLAGTLALMTGYAEHQCEQGNATRRHLMATKIVSNLYFLASHPQMPSAMALVMRNLQNHWHTLGALGALESGANAVLWHPQHACVQ